jgi:hypothetical protein
MERGYPLFRRAVHADDFMKSVLWEKTFSYRKGFFLAQLDALANRIFDGRSFDIQFIAAKHWAIVVRQFIL